MTWLYIALPLAGFVLGSIVSITAYKIIVGFIYYLIKKYASDDYKRQVFTRGKTLLEELAGEVQFPGRRSPWIENLEIPGIDAVDITEAQPEWITKGLCYHHWVDGVCEYCGDKETWIPPQNVSQRYKGKR